MPTSITTSSMLPCISLIELHGKSFLFVKSGIELYLCESANSTAEWHWRQRLWNTKMKTPEWVEVGLKLLANSKINGAWTSFICLFLIDCTQAHRADIALGQFRGNCAVLWWVSCWWPWWQFSVSPYGTVHLSSKTNGAKEVSQSETII